MDIRNAAKSATLAALVVCLGGISATRSMAQNTSSDWQDKWEKPYNFQQPWDQSSWEQSTTFGDDSSRHVSEADKNRKREMKGSGDFKLSGWSNDSIAMAELLGITPEMGHPMAILVHCPATASTNEPIMCKVFAGATGYISNGANRVTVQLSFLHGDGAYSTDGRTWTNISKTYNPAVVTVPLVTGRKHGWLWIVSHDNSSDTIEISPDFSTGVPDPMGACANSFITTKSMNYPGFLAEND